MENQFDNTLVNEMSGGATRPGFLKVLCILSFVGSGLMIIAFALGTVCLGLSEETVASVWDKVVVSQPELKDGDPMSFFHSIGMLCVYNLILNIFSVIGVIMMWRLNKIGFFIYLAAELLSNFTAYAVGLTDFARSSSGQLIFNLGVDMVFIVMYALNLKHMKSNSN